MFTALSAESGGEGFLISCKATYDCRCESSRSYCFSTIVTYRTYNCRCEPVVTMPAKDRYHDSVVRALIKDGWTISRQQVKIIAGDRYLWIDIEAAKVGDSLVILVEVKELEEVFSPIEAFANAVGKYFLYRTALDIAGTNVPLYVAVTQAAFEGILSEEIGQRVVRSVKIPLIVFDPGHEEIIRWIP